MSKGKIFKWRNSSNNVQMQLYILIICSIEFITHVSCLHWMSENSTMVSYIASATGTKATTSTATVTTPPIIAVETKTGIWNSNKTVAATFKTTPVETIKSTTTTTTPPTTKIWNTDKIAATIFKTTPVETTKSTTTTTTSPTTFVETTEIRNTNKIAATTFKTTLAETTRVPVTKTDTIDVTTPQVRFNRGTWYKPDWSTNIEYYASESGVIKNYKQSSDFCKKYGGTLAIIKTKDAQDFISSLVQKDSGIPYGFFIGLQRLNGSNFEWIDGTSPTFESWEVGEPNNYGGNSNCVIAGWVYTYEENLKWRDFPCDDRSRGPTGFICQRIIATSTNAETDLATNTETSMSTTDVNGSTVVIISSSLATLLVVGVLLGIGNLIRRYRCAKNSKKIVKPTQSCVNMNAAFNPDASAYENVDDNQELPSDEFESSDEEDKGYEIPHNYEEIKDGTHAYEKVTDRTKIVNSYKSTKVESEYDV